MLLDAPPQFDLVLFDYTGRQETGAREVRGLRCHVLAGVTECKGEIYQALAKHLLATTAERAAMPPEYVALIDDDILMSVGDVNRCLHLGRCAGLDVFAPALSHDSDYSHSWTLRQPNRMYREVDWVEVMMPFYAGEVFLAGAPEYDGNISSWGIDKYLIPTLQQLAKRPRTAIIDAVMAGHHRRTTSGKKTYRNGRSAAEERDLMKARCVALIAERAPELRTGAWFERIFVRPSVRTRWQKHLDRLGRPLRRWLDQST